MAKERPDLNPLIGQKLTVIAWLWARTVRSPNPAFAEVDVPLAATFMLSAKPDKEAYVEPVIANGDYSFRVKVSRPKDSTSAKNGTKLSRGANFRCLMSDSVIEAKYIRSEAQAGPMGARLMAVIAEGERGRVYLTPQPEWEEIARSALPEWKPELKVTTPCHDVDRLPMYGMPTWGDAFTPRQLAALTTFSDLVQEVRDLVKREALTAGMIDDGKSLSLDGSGVQAYADAVSVYLAFAADKAAEGSTTLGAGPK
jgi:putative DNA methylase